MAILLAGLSFGIGINPPLDIHVPDSQEIYDMIDDELFDLEDDEYLSFQWIIDPEPRS